MKRQEKIERTLQEYFGGSLVQLSVVTIGIITNIEATYQNFESVPKVRQWIDANIPDVGNITLYRSYSDEHIREALWRAYEDSVDVQEYVEGLLFAQSFY